MSLNPLAKSYFPVLSLLDMPFVKQRFERFVTFQLHHAYDPKELRVLEIHPSIQPTQKKQAVFVCAYKHHRMVYEADKVEDPRTGIVRKA